MLGRLLELPKDESFFLFGPRGVGKSTLLKASFPPASTLWINLLEEEQESQFASSPGELKSIVDGLPKNITHVVIDEVQKVPKLLDEVHSLIENTHYYFILSGSSARKLKRGGANLLAGRAFVYLLSTFSYLELKSVDMQHLLQWGALPKIFSFDTDKKKMKFLQAYCHTYLKEEVAAEQHVKDLDPFRRFLEVAAQMNGKIINYQKIARDSGVNDRTLKNYYSILEDTLLGFFLEPFKHSFRKRLSLKPKFYFFDPGVVACFNRRLSVPLTKRTSLYGEVFEHYIITECIKLANIYHEEYRFSYIQTKDGAEVDLVVERPGLSLLLIEIKSTALVTKEHIKTLERLGKDLEGCEMVCFAQEKRAKRYGDVMVLPWEEGVKKYFGAIY